MEQRAENSCGSHGADANGNPAFDYTCDDCMLPYNHREYDETPEYIAIYGMENSKKRIRQAAKKSKKRGKIEPPPF